MEKNTAAGGWPSGEEGWLVAALEHGGESRGGVVVLECMWLCGHDGGTVNGEERRRAHEQIRLGERIRKWSVGSLAGVVTHQRERPNGQMDVLRTALPKRIRWRTYAN